MEREMPLRFKTGRVVLALLELFVLVHNTACTSHSKTYLQDEAASSRQDPTRTFFERGKPRLLAAQQAADVDLQVLPKGSLFRKDTAYAGPDYSHGFQFADGSARELHAAFDHKVSDNLSVIKRVDQRGPDFGLTETAKYAANAANRKRGKNVVLVNCMPWHYEVEFGFSKLLKELGYSVTLYTYMDKGQWNNLGRTARGTTARQVLLSKVKIDAVRSCRDVPKIPEGGVEALIYLSTDDEVLKNPILKTYLKFLDHLQPRRVIGVLHVMKASHMRVVDFFRMNHPRVFLLTLGPSQLQKLQIMHQKNVARTFDLSSVPLRADWMLPFFSFDGVHSCTDDSVQCYTTFSIQGNLWQQQRNYSGLFNLLHTSEITTFPNFRVKLVGGGNPKFQVPEQLQQRVNVYRELGFQEFFNVLHRSVALVPLFNNKEYLDGTRISSTFIVSLVTNTPVLANRQIMQSYSWLNRDAVFYQEDDETEVDAMWRILQMGKNTTMRVRKNLMTMKQELDARNKQVLRDAIEKPWEEVLVL